MLQQKRNYFVICVAIVRLCTVPHYLGAAEELSAEKGEANQNASPREQVTSDLAVLTIIDEAGKSHPVTTQMIASLSHTKLRAKAHDVESEFSGVLLVDMLKSIGVEFGEKLRGKRASDVVIIEAGDGYRTALSLLEIDPATTDKVVLLADQKDGKPLEEKEGPLRLVIPDEKRPVRWIRMVKTIRVANLRDYPISDPGSAEATPGK